MSRGEGGHTLLSQNTGLRSRCFQNGTTCYAREIYIKNKINESSSYTIGPYLSRTKVIRNGVHNITKLQNMTPHKINGISQTIFKSTRVHTVRKSRINWFRVRFDIWQTPPLWPSCQRYRFYDIVSNKKIVRFSRCYLRLREHNDIRFIVRFPDNNGTRAENHIVTL